MEWPNKCTNTIKLKRNIIQDRTLVKGQEIKSFGPFARQNQPQTCQLCMAKRVEVPPRQKKPKFVYEKV